MQRKAQNFNYKVPLANQTEEKNNGISQTVPDQTMSIMEIMQRHSRGMSLSNKVPLYHEESEIETESGRDIRTMDLSEVQQEMEEINERVQEDIKTKEENRKKKQIEESARREQEQREKWRKEFEEEQRQKQSKP